MVHCNLREGDHCVHCVIAENNELMIIMGSIPVKTWGHGVVCTSKRVLFKSDKYNFELGY